jgi:hypothetical protein
MPTPTDYIRAAQGRISTAQGPATLNAYSPNLPGPAAPDEQAVGPMREASPEDAAALPRPGMVTRSGDVTWIPGQWLKTLAGNPDTILAKDGSGLKLFEALLDDDVAFSTLQQRRLAITSRDWEVAPGDDTDPRSVKAADQLRAMIKAVGWDRVTGLMHYGVWFGYAVGECIWTTKQHNGELIVWLDDVVVPDRRWFGFTLEGELRMLGTLNASVNGEELPPNKFWTIRTGGTHDFAFYGMGLAHWVYWLVFFKRAAIKFWALYLEKLGMPTVAIEFPSAEKNDKQAQADRLQAAAAVGQDRAVLVPEGTLTNDQMKLLEATRSAAGTSGYAEFIDEQNESIMRVVLGQPGTSKGVSSGLNSDQASEHAGVKAEIVKADSDLMTEAFARGPAKWLTRWNHGPDVAPPTLYRVLDNAEDLNTIADRDVKLAGIGIKRTKDSVGDVYGDGYEIAPTPPKAGNKQIAAALGGAIDPETGTIIPEAVPAANDNAKRVAAFAAEYGVDDTAPLYVSRQLLNAADLIAWAKGQGFKVTVPAADMHVTILYSKQPVDWFGMGQPWSDDDQGRTIVPPGGPRAVEQFGEGAVVLRFASADLQWRHDSMVERGASHDFDSYSPHVTISYDAEGVDLSKVEPYQGELRFGPEIFEPIRTGEAFDPATLNFTADQEQAIERLVKALVEDANPVFAAMADELRTGLQGVNSLEGARVAILEAWERMPIDKLARLTGLPMLAERVGALAGAEEDVTA